MLLEGLLNLPTWGYLGITLLLTHITIASVTIFLHRHQSHNALTLHPLISHLFRFWLWLTTGMVTKEWVAIHRKHHAKCETEEDPHSPKFKGIYKVLFEGVMLYRNEARNMETLDKYGHKTPDDWLERKLYSRFPFLGITLMALLDVLLFGAIGIAIFAVQMLWIPFLAAGVINGIGHYWGYRNFETQDASTNILPWGILIGGEELHNNHHAHSTSAKLSSKWWEFDIGWMYIRLLELSNLAKVKRVAPKVHTVSGKQVVDVNTLRAILSNRFHILKLYGRKVIYPALKGLCLSTNKNERKLFKLARKLITREDIHIESTEKQTLDNILQYNCTLETIFQFKQQLKGIWAHTSHKKFNRIQRLQTWCTEAEQTGISVLQDFATFLRSYSLHRA